MSGNKENGLPDQFEVVVLGTGVAESIIAAACSRIGKSVLHLDWDTHYGSSFSTLSWKGFQSWIAKQEKLLSSVEQPDVSTASHSSSTTIRLNEKPTLKNIKQWWSPRLLCESSSEDSTETEDERDGINTDQPTSSQNTSETSNEEQWPQTTYTVRNSKHRWTQQELERFNMKFNLDLSPRILYSRGSMVELLISSNIGRYLEFKCVPKVLCELKGKLLPVPCSRSDVFASKGVTVVQKRMLMKFMQAALSYENHPEEFSGYEDRPFDEYLKHKQMPENLFHYIKYVIARADEDLHTRNALRKIQLFLQSLGRYGNSPFLWPLYGSGEIAQAFCRMCAVYGGTYYLGRGIQEIHVCPGGGTDSQEVNFILTNEQRISCQKLVLLRCFHPIDPINRETYSHAVVLTDESLVEAAERDVCYGRFPPEPTRNQEIVDFIQLPSASLACPQDLYLVHLMTNGTSQDLEVVIQSHFHITDDSERTAEEKPAVLWYCIYEDQDDSRSEFLDAELPQGLFFVPGQSWELDFDSHVQQARTVFERMYPGEDFLPRAPDPEDIVVLDPPAPEPEQQERNNEEDGDVTEEDVDENRRGTEEVRENEGRDQGEVEAGAVKEDVDGE